MFDFKTKKFYYFSAGKENNKNSRNEARIQERREYHGSTSVIQALRPVQEKAADVAALPYDVVNREKQRQSEIRTHYLFFM